MDNQQRVVNEENSARKCIVVAGMHRSGTSALTRVLNLLGAKTGYSLQEPGFDNVKGFWEPKEIVDIHEQLLTALGVSHDSYVDITDEQLRADVAKYAVSRIVSFLHTSFDQGDRLVIVKDPRLCRLIPIWLESLECTQFDPLFVLPIRHPMEVAHSLKRRNGYHLHKGLLMWLRHVLAAERATRDYQRSFVAYDALMTDWRKVTKKIARDLKLSWPKDSASMAADVEDFLDTGLRHHLVDPQSCDTDIEWVSDCWACIRELVTTGKCDFEQLDRISRELRNAEMAFAPLDQFSEDRLATSAAEYDAKLKFREDELAHVRHAEYVLETRVADQKVLISEASTKVTQLEEQIDSLHTQEIARFRQEVDDLNAVIESLHQKARADEDALMEQQQRLEAKIIEIEAEALKNEGRALESEARVRETQALLEALQADSAVAMRQRDEMVNELSAQNGFLAAKCKESETRLTGYIGISKSPRLTLPDVTRPHNFSKNIIFVNKISSIPLKIKQKKIKKNNIISDIKIISESGLFDRDYYLSQYSDVKNENIDPVVHYCKFGYTEGRNPSADFDTLFYSGSNPDVIASGINPFVHWILHGRQEGRRGTQVYSANAFPVNSPFQGHPNAPKTGILSEPAASQSDYDLIAASGQFDTEHYLHYNPDVAKAGVNPLDHFCRCGWKEGRNPSATFNVHHYLRNHPTVDGTGENPFVHWIINGQSQTGLVAPNFSQEDDWGITDRSFNPSVIFVSHEASRTGAPKVLLSMLRWIKTNMDIEFGIIVGADGPLHDEFRALGPCLFLDAYPHEIRQNKLREFCGVNVQAVYLNTIVSAIYGSQLTFLNAKFITHVHEMENVFSMFEEPFRHLLTFCSDFIAVSEGSVEAVQRRTNGQDVTITRIAPFIDRFERDNRFSLPRKSQNPPIIYACGTLEARKGPDIFCDVAEILLKEGVTNFRMKWIGPKADYDLAAEIALRNLGAHVEWLGAQPNPRQLLSYGAMFVLPSREDAFPLVCLEAAEQGLPVICFDHHAGSMHSFVGDDAGIVIRYLDSQEMAHAIKTLLQDEVKRQRLGTKAKAKMEARHLSDVVCPQIISLLPPLIPSEAIDEFEAYKEQIDRAEIVSFDIFDTLITRRLSNPSTVFDIVEHRHSHNQAAALGLFNERMRVAGSVLAKYNGERDDVTIDEIYKGMSFFRNADVEKKTEIDIAVVHPLGRKLYEYAREAGKHIIIVSDMYLDETTIGAMLTKCGIAHWDRLFLSSTLGLKKDTGRLYQTVLKYADGIGVRADQILHIGDNWEGDIHKAKAAGLKAIRFVPLYDKALRKFPLLPERVNKLSQVGRIWNDFTTQAAKLWKASCKDAGNDFYMTLGFEISGPLASMMAIYIRAQADKLGIGKIVFMARDGRIIKKAFEALFRDDIAAGKYEVVYAHLSRAVVIPATLQNPLSSSDLYFLIEGLHLGQKSVRYFVEKAGLDATNPAVVRKVKNHFTSMNTVPTWEDLLAMTSLMNELSAAIHAANAPERDKFAAYLRKQTIDQNEKMIMVDVGWLLNIQSRFHQFCKDTGIPEQTVGIYVGSRDRVDKSLPHAALLFDGGDPRHYADLIEENTTLFEILFSAPEPSASGLIWGDDGEIEVALKPLQMPRSKEFDIARKIHFGAEAYFDQLATALKIFMPERVSRDFFFAAFEALVYSSDVDANHEFGNFEVLLGGHHEFVAHQKLLKGQPLMVSPPKPHSEYFSPVHLGHDGDYKVAIITSAGLDNGSTRYRGFHLGLSLNAMNVASTLFHSETDMEIFEREIARFDTVVFQRCFKGQGNVGAMYTLARRLGKRCVMEIDDLVFPEFLSVIGSVVGGEWNHAEALLVSSAYETMLNDMDGAIASTHVISEFIEKKWKVPTATYRNRIQKTAPQITADNNKLRIIYASGTYSHKDDYRIIADGVRHILESYPNVSLSLLGATQVPDDLLGMPNVSAYPMLPYEMMLSFIASHDLMVVPLADNVFNHAKSNVKFIESASVGVAVLASGVSEYASIITDGANGFTANTPDEWLNKLKKLVENRALLKSVGSDALRFVENNYLCSTLDETTVQQLKKVLFAGKLN